MPTNALEPAAAFGVVIASTGITVAVLVALLVIIGLMMIAVAMWLVRSTRSDPAALGPLEVMGERRWRKGDTDLRRTNLDTARPPGAPPPAPMVALDLAATPSDEPPAGTDPTPPGLPTPESSDTETETEAVAETDVDAETEAVAETEVDADAEVDADTGTDATTVAETDVDAEAEVDADSGTDAPTVVAETEVVAEANAETAAEICEPSMQESAVSAHTSDDREAEVDAGRTE